MTTHDNMPPVMILCGGKGTRLRDVTELLPKPMVPIGEQPIVWHIMRSYAAFGVKRFILCLGYKREAFVDFFMNYHSRTSDTTIRLGQVPEVTFHSTPEESGWEITLAGTGQDTMTGGRVLQASKYLRTDDREFFLTYGDGVADVNMAELLETHRQSGKMITVTGVHPEARFGTMELSENNVSGFHEKPAQVNGYISGGFMVVNREFIGKYLSGREDGFFEQYPMQTAVADGVMGVYRHEGFWQCMDNQREYLLLNRLWDEKRAPWTTHWKKG